MRIRLVSALFLILTGTMSVIAYYEGRAAGERAVIAKVGDWLVIRRNGGCSAYDPSTTTVQGQWPVRSDGRCHLSDYLADRVFGEH